MTRAALCCLLAAALSLPALAAAQTVAAQVVPAPPETPTLVAVDVVVTDAGHNPIHDLKASDFTLLEDAHPQTIATFEEHRSWEAASPLPLGPALPAGTFSNLTIAPVHGALNILLLDLLNTTAPARAELHSRMIRYLQQVHPGTRIAVLGLTNRLILLQGFTSDPQLLSSVLRAKEEPPAASSDSAVDDAPRPSLGNNPSAAQVEAGLRLFNSGQPALPFQTRAHLTLDALDQLARTLDRLPGRKNLIWISNLFPINPLPDGAEPTPFAAVASAEEEFRQTALLLSRAQVSVYPIGPMDTASAPSSTGPNPNAKYIRGPVSHTSNPADLYQLTNEEPGTMQAMALATGGEPIALTDDLKDAVDTAINRGSNYYTLAYAPTAPGEAADYRAIRVNAANAGLTLAYRRGYFTSDLTSPATLLTPLNLPDQVDQLVHRQPTNAPPAYSPLHAAMALAAPVPTEIIFEATVAALSTAEPNSPFRRYSLQLGISAHDLVCPTGPGGAYECTLEISIAALDASGASIDLGSGAIHASIPVAQFAATLESGLSFHQDIGVPLASATFLRIGIRDRATDTVGAVEIPLSAIANLPPPAPAK